jgi:hypothetical protein
MTSFTYWTLWLTLFLGIGVFHWGFKSKLITDSLILILIFLSGWRIIDWIEGL